MKIRCEPTHNNLLIKRDRPDATLAKVFAVARAQRRHKEPFTSPFACPTFFIYKLYFYLIDLACLQWLICHPLSYPDRTTSRTTAFNAAISKTLYYKFTTGRAGLEPAIGALTVRCLTNLATSQH